MRDPTILVDGDLAVAFEPQPHARRSAARVPVDLWYRTTLCFQRQRGKWKVVHEHGSVPMLMDGSGKAATQLRP